MASNNIYESLGVKPLINAAGTFTDLGGSLMPPEVIEAWTEAAKHFVDMHELQDRVGADIADRLGVEAAMVTGGAASGILLGLAAAISAKRPEYVQTHFADDDRPWEVLRQTRHRDLYDRQIETSGARIVEVETAADVAEKVSERTVLMMAYNVYESEGTIGHAEWLQLAKEHQVPTLIDTAADVPPVENLSKFCQMGYDLVTFSGGKAIRGPQSTGLLLGRKSLIDAAKTNASPHEGTIGRVAKVSKEDIVAFWTALQLFLHDGDKIAERCQKKLQQIETKLFAIAGVTCTWVTPPVANHFPHLKLTWDESKFGMTAGDLALALRNGTPPIATGRVYGTGDDGLLISAVNLQTGEAEIVAQRIVACFLKND